jgi:ergothioneine biosynthesis protein EgtB
MREWMIQCRAATLNLFDGIDHATFCYQAHPDFSPIGWHLGHIAFTEALWLLEHCAGQSKLFPQYRRLFAVDGVPKSERVHLPPLTDVQDYLKIVRSQVFDYLETAPIELQERLWHFVLQHESQHYETIAIVLELQKLARKRKTDRGKGKKLEHRNRKTTELIQEPKYTTLAVSISSCLPSLPNMLYIPAGTFQQGSHSIEALDNERPSHAVYLDAYWIDPAPVACGQYRIFMEAGGYHNSAWWSADGWQWLQTAQITAPLYWSDDLAWDAHPVYGVNWYEADAYARFVGKRLPTEAEWEKAVQTHSRCWDMLGTVWEWTSSWFTGYPAFEPFPYRGYSQAYFDQQHRVLRGGSWATHPWILRSTFRNWYHLHVREVFAGFRCASDD